jgi:hypothetical protein
LPWSSAQSVASAHATPQCDPCCPARVAAIPACCVANPQPAATVPVPFHDVTVQPASFQVPGEGVVPAPIASRARLRVAPPPLLQTNLRI